MASLSKIPGDSGREESRYIARIKRGAHAVTFLSVIWLLFDVFGLLLFREGRIRHQIDGVVIGSIVWSIHLLLIGVSVRLWLKEQPKEVEMFKTEIDIS
jgi:hypothetical protein